MKKSTKNMMLCGGILLAGMGAVTALSYKMVQTLVDTALDRKVPKIMHKSQNKISGSSVSAELITQMDMAEQALLSRAHQDVEITSHDGLRLVGHWYGKPDAKRVLVAMHGWRSSWTKDFGIISDFWFQNDCAVLFAEQRGQGESDGEYMSFGLLERHDCRAWIDWVIRQTEGKLPVYLCGLSMGATTILMTANLDLPPEVKGIMADCGFTSPQEIWRHVVNRNLGLAYNGIPAFFAQRLCKEKINLTSTALSTVDTLQECSKPVLFVHGTDDHFVPVEMTYENYKACASQKHLLIVPGADHALSYLTDRDAYQATARRFWRLYDNT